MRNRELHGALRAFALDAAALLTDAQAAGAELEFELDEGRSRRRGPALYHLRPLTDAFIAARWSRICALPTFRAATGELGAAAAALAGGGPRPDAEPTLRDLLDRLYEDVTDFGFPEERFERIYADLEQAMFEDSRRVTVLAPVYGLALAEQRVELGDGLWIARGAGVEAPEEAVWGGPAAREGDAEGAEPNALVGLTRELRPGDAGPAAEAADRFRRTLTGLRLWKAGGVALSSLGWLRAGEERWRPFELESSGVPRGEPWILVEGEADQLRAFLATLADGRLDGTGMAWALGRFEMGLGRRREYEALSDYLLALRALLDPDISHGRESLALRMAVLCAEERERKRTQRRVESALELEHFVMRDGADEVYFQAVGAESPRTLVDELERHLRALLRDLICGYLDPDLRSLADDILLDQRPAQTAPEDHATDEPEPEPELEPEPEPELEWEPELDALAADPPRPPAAVASEIEALEDEPADLHVRQAEPDWDDPESYSAPV